MLLMGDESILLVWPGAPIPYRNYRANHLILLRYLWIHGRFKVQAVIQTVLHALIMNGLLSIYIGSI